MSLVGGRFKLPTFSLQDDPFQSAPACVCRFNPEGLHGHLLGVAGEDGCVSLFDTRKQLSKEEEEEKSQQSRQFMSSRLFIQATPPCDWVCFFFACRNSLLPGHHLQPGMGHWRREAGEY